MRERDAARAPPRRLDATPAPPRRLTLGIPPFRVGKKTKGKEVPNRAVGGRAKGSGRIKKGGAKVWHKCNKCKNRFAVKPETKTAQHQDRIAGARCGGRCEGYNKHQPCGGCS